MSYKKVYHHIYVLLLFVIAVSFPCISSFCFLWWHSYLFVDNCTSSIHHKVRLWCTITVVII